MTTIQVKVTIGDKQVTLDGPEDFVRAEVQRLTNSLVAMAPKSRETGSASRNGEEPVLPQTEREFVAAKRPSGHPETCVVLGYFLTKNGRDQFTFEDMKRAYARAHVRPPKAMAQALRDAKNHYDYLEAGSDRGTFRLSAHGQRTVEFDLPRTEAGG